MALIANLDSALLGDVDVSFTLNAPSITATLYAVDPLTGIVLGQDSGISPLSVTSLPQDRDLHFTVVGFDISGNVSDVSNTIVLNSNSWGDVKCTYIVTDSRSDATEYRLYDDNTAVLLNTSPVNMLQDCTVYASEGDADEVQYRVEHVVKNIEELGQCRSRSRHNHPTCLLTWNATDLIGDPRMQGRFELIARFPRVRDRLANHEPYLHRGVFFHRQSIVIVPGREGLCGAYLPWDLPITIQAREYGLQADFVVPRQATADLDTLTLVPHFQGPANA